eukprot:TRINITY_DN6365_c0_g1_i1.p1 TRINITY_DN6365_c0_g1~~TRINITY_DN6365_c0_g1_i1.p1  ORF type:complete len:461 (-),score=95.51 TRINITY_DN6365_c0_g1_i1:11-1393(-)
MGITTVDLIILARWVVPVVPKDVLLKDHAVVVHEGVVVDVVPVSSVKEQYSSDCIRDVSDRGLVMPGLVNCHTHLAMTLLRGLADDVSLMEWLTQYIWPLESKFVSEEFIRAGSELAVAEMIQCGTTTFNDMYFYPHVSAAVAEAAGMRAMIGIPIMKFPSNWAKDTAEYFSKGLAKLYEPYKDSSLISVALAPHAPYTVDNDGFKEVKRVSDELGLRVHVHLHETTAEVNRIGSPITDSQDVRPIRRLEACGLLSEKLIAVHMTQLDDDELQLVLKNNVNVVHCPESNMKLASGVCPIGRLVEAGVNVALGTDGAASNDDCNMLGELHTASLLNKLHGTADSGKGKVLNAFRLIEMATINGAKALGLADRVGSLEKGKAADIIVVDMNCEPVYNAPYSLVHNGGTTRVSDVWVGGKCLYDQGTLITLDVKAITARAREWGTKIEAHHLESKQGKDEAER